MCAPVEGALDFGPTGRKKENEAEPWKGEWLKWRGLNLGSKALNHQNSCKCRSGVEKRKRQKTVGGLRGGAGNGEGYQTCKQPADRGGKSVVEGVLWRGPVLRGRESGAGVGARGSGKRNENEKG